MDSDTFSKTVLFCCVGSNNLKTIWNRVNNAVGEKVSKAVVIEEVKRIYAIESKRISSLTL